LIVHFDRAILIAIDWLDRGFMQTSLQWHDLLIQVTFVAVELAHSRSSLRSIKSFAIIVATELFFCDHHRD
jgi:hypothetical protein